MVLQALHPLMRAGLVASENLNAVRTVIDQVTVTTEGLTLTFVDGRLPQIIKRDWAQNRDLYEKTSDPAAREADPQQIALVRAIARAQHWVEYVIRGRLRQH